MRRLLPLLLAVPLLPAPARADVGAYTFFATADVDCFGCGVSRAHGYGTFTGVVGSHAFVQAPLVLDFTVYEVAGSMCFITGTANGLMVVDDGAATASWSFNWTRVDVRVLASTYGSVNGAFATTFVPTSPVDQPCGHRVAFDMRGTGAGT